MFCVRQGGLRPDGRGGTGGCCEDMELFPVDQRQPDLLPGPGRTQVRPHHTTIPLPPYHIPLPNLTTTAGSSARSRESAGKTPTPSPLHVLLRWPAVVCRLPMPLRPLPCVAITGRVTIANLAPPSLDSPSWQQLSARGPVTVTFMAQCDDLGGRVRHLEHAELVLSLNYSRRGALSMRLTSPQGGQGECDE